MTTRFTLMAANAVIEAVQSPLALFRRSSNFNADFLGTVSINSQIDGSLGISRYTGEILFGYFSVKKNSTADIFLESGRLYKNNTFIYKLNFNGVYIYLSLHYEEETIDLCIGPITMDDL